MSEFEEYAYLSDLERSTRIYNDQLAHAQIELNNARQLINDTLRNLKEEKKELVREILVNNK